MPYDVPMPPPPWVTETEVIDLVTGAAERMSARLDTGADMSALPETTVRTLHLLRRSEAWFKGYDNVWTRRPTYYVGINVGKYCIPIVQVTSSPRADVLLGRDVLNRFHVTFNGRDLTYEMRDP